MPRANSPNAARSERRPRWPTLFLALLCCMGTPWGGCARENRYRVLSFFFDGVPDPNAPSPIAETDQGGWSTTRPGGPRSGMGSVHKPFADNQCTACHKESPQGGFALSAVNPNICLDCHQPVMQQYAVMHAPVVAKACLWCHNPHDSPAKSLLREPPPGICTQCHEKGLLSSKPPEHLLTDSKCLECHVAHGADKRNLLRASISPATPSTPPASLPAPGGVP